ncbi:DUF58 domain-containing protein [Paenibacillus marinisediminis]
MTGSSQSQPRRQSMIKMWIVAVLIYVALIFYFLFQGGKTSFMLLVMATVLGVYWIAGSVGGIRRVSGQRIVGGDGHKHFVADSNIPVQLSIRIPGWLPLPYIIVNDEIYRFGKLVGQYESIVTMDSHRQAEVQYHTPPLPRGCYQFTNTICRTKDLFGLFEHKGEFQATQSIYVLPQTVPIASWRQSRAWNGLSHLDHALTKDRRESTHLNGIREYAYGDKLSRVHWNATAKTGMMKSKQFEPEGFPQLVLVLDQSVFAYDLADQFELAVSAVASLAAYARVQQRRTVVIGMGEEPKIWTDDAVRYESLPYRQWLASVQRERDLSDKRTEPIWIDKWSNHPELRRGGVVVWISGRVQRSQLISIAALAKRNWHGTYLHVGQYTAAAQESVAETSAVLMKYRYQYVKISDLHELPARLEGTA